jgi:glycine/D-amino acid oxidase-like deaminating enzyme
VRTAEVVVVGGGVEGLSIAYALCDRGRRDVLVLERDMIGSGFTAKSSGIVRCHYGVRSLAAMAWRSLAVLEDAETALGADIGFHRCGYLVGVGPDDSDALAANLAMQREIGVDVTTITPDEAAELFPQMRVDDFAAFGFEPRGGYADGYQTAAAFAAASRRGGAEIVQGCGVKELLTSGEKVTGVLTADGERVSAGCVVVAAGPWSSDLVGDVGVELPLRAMREQLMVVDPGGTLGEVPVLSDLVSLQYLRPERTTDLLVGNSDHHDPEWVDPDRYDNTLDDDFAVAAIEKFSHRFPGLSEASLSSSYAGCYDVTPDYNPVMGPTPLDGLYLCAGFSGHGYKISPAVGVLMADILCDGASRDPDVEGDDFRLGRFDEGALLVSPHPYLGAPEMR